MCYSVLAKCLLPDFLEILSPLYSKMDFKLKLVKGY